ncbi:MAG: ParB/RepB/Spo0J family partition protein [Gammaproteobacteria bacterium]|nr:ParB/RepB/Spo0J family partition protein [Gammaproteobacteria bacterium]
MSRKLGKGLEALLGSRDKESMSALMEDGPAAPAQEGELREIPIDLIRPGKFQPRQDMRAQALEELAQSIHQQGVMQPVVVREIGQGRFELIAGERRWRACQLSGLKAIPALVKSASDRDVVSMSLIENIQREDLNPIEQAAALQRLQEEFGFTQQEVAKEVGKSRESVANLLRLLGVEPDVRAMLEKGELEMGHARALLGVSGPDQPKLARQVARKQLSVRQTEDLVRRHLSRADSTPSTRERDPDLARLEESLSEKLGSRVAIQHTAKGKGKLVINYNNVTELEGILSHIK